MAICKPDFNSNDFDSNDFHTSVIAINLKKFIQDRLPDYFRRNDTYIDANGDGLLIRYLAIFGEEIDEEIIPTIECYLNIIDAHNCDYQYLTHISDVLGNPPDIFGNEAIYRNLLSYICSVYKIKGTKKAYELFFSLLGFDVELTEIPLQNSLVNYDDPVNYDEGSIYDGDTCTPCSMYDIVLYPTGMGSNYNIDSSLIVRLREAIRFNEPINAKLRHLTIGINLLDSLELHISDDVTTESKVIDTYDIGKEYDSGKEYDESADIMPGLLVSTMKIIDDVVTNNHSITSEILHNFTGDIDTTNTQLTLTAIDSYGVEIYKSIGTLILNSEVAGKIKSTIIRTNHLIGTYDKLRLTGVITLEDGKKANINTLVNNNITTNIYFI